MKKMASTFLGKAALVALTTALILSSTACSSSTAKEQSDVSTNSTAEKNVTLKLITWTNETSIAAIKTLNEDFKAKYPNITVEVSDVSNDQYSQLQQTRISAGDVDIFSSGAFSSAPETWAKGMNNPSWVTLVESGTYLDITDQSFVKNWNQNAIKDACTYQGKVYGINMGRIGYNGLFYNKSYFEQNGFKVPETWDEFMKLCKDIQTKGMAPMTIGGKDVWPIDNLLVDSVVGSAKSDILEFNKGLWEGRYKFNNDDSLKILNKLNECAQYFEKGFMGTDCNTALGRFVAGKAAMFLSGTWDAANISAADSNLKFGYFCIPGDEKNSDPAQLQGKYDLQFEICSNTKNKDACLKWFDFLSQKENYTKFVNKIGFIPTMDGITVDNEFVNSLANINKDFKLGYETVFLNPKGIGKYAGFRPSQLKVYGGTVATAQELTNLSQKDWDAAISAISATK